MTCWIDLLGIVGNSSIRASHQWTTQNSRFSSTYISFVFRLAISQSLSSEAVNQFFREDCKWTFFPVSLFFTCKTVSDALLALYLGKDRRAPPLAFFQPLAWPGWVFSSNCYLWLIRSGPSFLGICVPKTTTSSYPLFSILHMNLKVWDEGVQGSETWHSPPFPSDHRLLRFHLPYLDVSNWNH